MAPKLTQSEQQEAYNGQQAWKAFHNSGCVVTATVMSYLNKLPKAKKDLTLLTMQNPPKEEEDASQIPNS